MKKSCLIVAGLVVVVVFACILGVGAWWVWSRYLKPAITPVAERTGSTMRETGTRPELPSVEMQVHSAGEGQAFTGWPLLVRVSVRCPLSSDSQKPKPVLIAGPGGSWQESLRLAVQDTSGAKVDWPWRQPKADGGTVTLDGRMGIEWVWWLTGDETQAIRAGKYRLTAVLDTAKVTAPGAWKGTVSSRSADLDLKAPGQLSAEQEALKEIQTAQAEALGGNSAAAVARLQTMLGRSPKDIEALSFCGGLLADSGRLEEALGMYNRAIDAWYESNPDAEIEPVLLLTERRRLRTRMLEQEQPSS